MGSKQSLSNGNEVEEATRLIAAFAQQNDCHIQVTCSVVLAEGGPDVLWMATAANARTGELAPISWALVNVACSGKEWVGLMAVFTNLLYKLDFAIGEAEMAGIGVNKA